MSLTRQELIEADNKLMNVKNNKERDELGYECASRMLQDKVVINRSDIDSAVNAFGLTQESLRGKTISELSRLARQIKIRNDGTPCVVITHTNNIKAGMISKNNNSYLDSQFAGLAYIIEEYEDGGALGLAGIAIRVAYIRQDCRMKKNKIATDILGKNVKGPFIIWSLESDITVEQIKLIVP